MRWLFQQAKKYIVTSVLTVAAIIFFQSAANAQDDNTLPRAGGTFVYPLFSKQFSENNKKTGLPTESEYGLYKLVQLIEQNLVNLIM